MKAGLKDLPFHLPISRIVYMVADPSAKRTKKRIALCYPSCVERKTRLELATPTLARLCSTNWAISANIFVECFSALWAENETRTRDPNLGKVVLYQLSYFRIIFWTLQPTFLPNCECKDIAFLFTSKTFYKKNAFFYFRRRLKPANIIKISSIKQSIILL